MSATRSRGFRATLKDAIGLLFLSVRPWKSHALVANGGIFICFFDEFSGFREDYRVLVQK